MPDPSKEVMGYIRYEVWRDDVLMYAEAVPTWLRFSFIPSHTAFPCYPEGYRWRVVLPDGREVWSEDPLEAAQVVSDV